MLAKLVSFMKALGTAEYKIVNHGSCLANICRESVGGLHATKREYRISNMECRMMKFSPLIYRFRIQPFMFDIRYSFGAHGKPVFIELPSAFIRATRLGRVRRAPWSAAAQLPP
jgi:hypothetical protein